jgi:hypothetical protein
MANGLICALAVFKNWEPHYIDAPKQSQENRPCKAEKPQTPIDTAPCHDCIWDMSEDANCMVCTGYSRFSRKQKPEAPAGLVEEVNNIQDYDAGLLNDYGAGKIGWWQDYIRSELERCNYYWREKIDSIISRHKPQEPLAVLADRKGITAIGYRQTNTSGKCVESWGAKIGPSVFYGKTYAEAESKARQYLEGLPDKGGTK